MGLRDPMRNINVSASAIAWLALLAVWGCVETKTAETEIPPASQLRQMGVALRASQASGGQSGLDRKIVYNARLELTVKNFSGVPERVLNLVKQFEAYVADSTLAGSTGESRSGTWKTRVPVVHFEEFVSAAKGLGELASASTSSQDVSEEYYDVEAR